MPDGVGSRYAPETVDRALIAGCAAVWLLALGLIVAAGAALANLGAAESDSDASTPWGLYAVIGVSIAVIALAVPMLLRARTSGNRPPRTAGGPVQQHRERHQSGYAVPAVAGSSHLLHGIPAATIDRMWLRCGVGVFLVLGAAFAAVALATTFMAVESEGVAWAFYGLAAALTIGMIGIPVVLLRQLRAELS